jgi:uncharacterized membrane protein
VAVRPHSDEIWSIGLVTGAGIKSLTEAVGTDMVTVFIPSSPTSFSGYVLVVPRDRVIELPLSVEEAMRLLVTGGVSGPLPKVGEEPAKQLPSQQGNTVGQAASGTPAATDTQTAPVAGL